ncbi:uncharacterized protein LOC141617330 [Silene latifolia]|uniref:uncharacterized protein LOC141617330 n=1 Tax=Silene latifolia TaxID=37657 RepID=UPI003D77816E
MKLLISLLMYASDLYNVTSDAPGLPLQIQTPNKKRRLSRQQNRLPAARRDQPIPTTQLRLPKVGACTKCLEKRLAYEPPAFCSADGTIQLPTNEYPPLLVRLYPSPDEDAVHFRTYARMYNNLFAFSSIGGDYHANTYKGIYVFQFHGQIYHHVPNLHPNDGKLKYLQLYFYDGQHEALNRRQCFPEVREDIIHILIQITQNNPYARFFRSLRDLPLTEKSQILISRHTVLDQRVYNAPTSDEVVIIWSESSSSSESNSPHIIVTSNDNTTHRIMHYYGCYDPLQYPLLFPAGECGWVQGLRKAKPNPDPSTAESSRSLPAQHKQTVQGLLDGELIRAGEGAWVSPESKYKVISCRRYYCYKLQIRPGNMLLRAGRCFQRYIVEFQKRGLPHVHFLIILKDGHKLKCAADYDNFVSAEIPTTANPSLHVIVLKHMMHSPCGKLNPECSCMKHAQTPGQCKYEYVPKVLHI